MNDAKRVPADPGGEPSRRETNELAWSLRIGLILSAALLAAGLVDFLARHPGEDVATALASNPVSDYLSLGGLASGIAGEHAQALLVLGIIGLVATTVFRVVLAGVHFAFQRERDAVWLSGAVTALLLLGLLVVGPVLR